MPEQRASRVEAGQLARRRRSGWKLDGRSCGEPRRCRRCACDPGRRRSPPARCSVQPAPPASCSRRKASIRTSCFLLLRVGGREEAPDGDDAAALVPGRRARGVDRRRDAPPARSIPAARRSRRARSPSSRAPCRSSAAAAGARAHAAGQRGARPGRAGRRTGTARSPLSAERARAAGSGWRWRRSRSSPRVRGVTLSAPAALPAERVRLDLDVERSPAARHPAGRREAA